MYRRFTPREAARIQSFPDNFRFTGSEGDAYRQIGNAIPPVLMWHIGNALSHQCENYNVNKPLHISIKEKQNLKKENNRYTRLIV